MAWIYLAELEESVSHSSHGSEPSLIVKTIDTLNRFYCLGSANKNCLLHQSGMTCRHCGLVTSRPWILSSEDSPVRTSALRELERAWTEADQGYFSRSFASLANFDRDSFSRKTSQLSLFGGLTEFSWSSLRWGTIVDGRLYQPQRWEPRTSESDGSYLLPTPADSEYGSSNNGTRDGVTEYATKGKPSLSTMARKNSLADSDSASDGEVGQSESEKAWERQALHLWQRDFRSQPQAW
jgi:hypothetical protein